FEENAAIATLDPGHIIFESAASENFQFCFELTGSPCESFILAREILHLLDRPPGVLKCSDQAFDSLEFRNGMAAVAQQSEAIKESVRCARDQLNVSIELVGIMNEFGEPEIADVETEVIGCDVLQFVRFVENHGAIVRQNRRDIRFSNRKIGEEQVMIHHDD